MAEEPINQEGDSENLDSPRVPPFTRDVVSPEFQVQRQKENPSMVSIATELGKDVEGLGCPSEGISLGIPDNVLHEGLTMHEMTFDAVPSPFQDDSSKSRY